MVVAHNPGLANPEISKIIGEQWRSLSEDDKSKWKALAEVRLASLKMCDFKPTDNYPRRKKPGISSNTLTTATSLGGMVGMEVPEVRPQELGTIHLVHHTVIGVGAD